MLVQLAVSLVGCLVLAFVHVASFLCCLGCEARHPSLAAPVWLLIMVGAILPLLAAVFCFYFSLSVGHAPRASTYVPTPVAPRAPVHPVEPRFLAEPHAALEPVFQERVLQQTSAQGERRTTPV